MCPANGEAAPLDEENPYAAVFETMPQALALWRLVRDDGGATRDLECCSTNEAFRDLFGVSDMVGRTLGEIDRAYRGDPDLLDVCLRVADTGVAEEVGVHYPEMERRYEVRVSQTSDEHLLTAVTDVTERRNMQARVEWLNYSLDRVNDYPAWSDSTGRIIEISDSGCKQLEYTREELLGMTIFDICPSLEREAWEKSWKRLRPPDFMRTESEHRTKSGRLIPVEITVYPIVFEGQEYHCTFCRDITERRQAESRLRRLQHSLDQLDDYPTWNDATGRIIEVSESTCRHLEYTREELLGMTVFDICPDIDVDGYRESWTKNRPGTSFTIEARHRTKSGRVFPVEIVVSPTVFDGQEFHCTFCRDITQHKLEEQALRESEEQLRRLYEAQSETLRSLKDRDEQLLHAQKMEAVGRLAGGIAHDFNNVLTTIIGYSDLLLGSPDCQGSLAEDVAEIKAAAERAGMLTRRILAFSRRQPLQPTLLSLNTIVSDTERLLARTIGADIELRTSLAPALGRVEVDEHQFTQILLNLAVNARDAMPQGGSLTIETFNIELDEAFCKTHPEAHPGPYVGLTVADTGSGIEPEVLTHVFEPFYTTKPPGQGTGLGLATVYGIVAQSGGCVYLRSTLGMGTTFTIYLPRVETEVQTVMVVDSDTTFRNVTTRVLQRQGFRPLPLETGERAADLLADPDVRVDLLLTDLSLSGNLQGARLASIAAERRPGLPVLFMSEPGRDNMVDTDPLKMCEEPLEKPFTAEELTRRVRTCLT